MMPLADLFVHEYVRVDDALASGVVPVPRRPGPLPTCSAAEVLTIALMRHLLARPSERAFVADLRREWRHYFPRLPTQSEFNRGPLADVAWHLTLPALTLIPAAAAAFVLITRGAIRAVLAEPYLTTARAKGLPETRVAERHAVPNALLPVLTLFGVRVGHVLSGSLGGVIVVERVCSVPGVGLLAFEAICARDYPVLLAVFLLGSAGMLLANLAVEFVYRCLEPRRGM